MFILSSTDLAGRRILIVEDEYHVAEEMAEAVRNAGGEVAGPVPSVAAALALIEDGASLDGAVLDIKIGEETAFPVAKALKARGVPVIFVTGYDDWFIPQAFEDVPLFQKPADPENVVRIMFESSTKRDNQKS